MQHQTLVPEIRDARLAAIHPPAVLLGDLTLVRPLGMAGIPVLLATPERGDASLASRFVSGTCLLPGFAPSRRDETAAKLLDLGERLRRSLGAPAPLLYGSDRHLEMIYRRRHDFEESFLVLLNEEEVGWALLDKERFYPLCEAKGIPAPRTARPGEPVSAALSRLGEPLIVKPKRKASLDAIGPGLFEGAAKARVFATRDELLRHPSVVRCWDELIVQEAIQGGPQSLWSFHGFADDRCELLASFCGRKIRTYPRVGGESSYIEVASSAEIEEAGRGVVRALGLRGPFKIDFMRGPDGRIHTLEVNARFNLWHYVGAASGVNLPAVAYDWLVRRASPRPRPEARPGHRWLHGYRDYQVFRQEKDAGRLGFAEWLGSIARPRVVYDVFAWTDPMPFFRWVSGRLREKAVAWS